MTQWYPLLALGSAKSVKFASNLLPRSLVSSGAGPSHPIKWKGAEIAKILKKMNIGLNGSNS